MEKMIELMDRSFPLSPALIADLEQSVRLRRFNPDQVLPWEELLYGLVYVKRGLIKEMTIVRSSWRCSGFIGEGQVFRVDEFAAESVESSVRWIAVRPVVIYFIAKRELHGLLHKHYSFIKYNYSSIRESFRRAILHSFTKGDAPKLRVRYLRQKFPDIFEHASAEDLSACLHIDIDKLRALVKGLK